MIFKKSITFLETFQTNSWPVFKKPDYEITKSIVDF